MIKFKNTLSFLDLPIFKIIIIGILLRLLTALFFTHTFDGFRILALSKSVADTGALYHGFFAIGGVQLYGKIYYQIIGLWMNLLNTFHIIDLRYIFDSRPYQQYGEYLQGFPFLSPELYQLVCIKLIQFLYDFLLLFFLIGTGKTLGIQNRKGLVLFWALNPLFIYIGYVIFQADLAMVAFFTGGAYFTLRALKNPNKHFVTNDKLLALFFFALGAVIKQIPVLVVPFALILFAESIIDGFIYCFSFVIFYLVLYQGWSADGILIKKYFLTSPESIALFNFGLNGINIFFMLYICVFFYFFAIKKHMKTRPELFIQLIVMVLAIVFIAEDTNQIFIQFNIWIMPFLAILSLFDKNYAFFLLGSLLGFYKRAYRDPSVLSGSASVTFGEPLSRTLNYEYFIGKIINPQIGEKLINTLFTAVYILLVLYLFFQLTGKKVTILTGKLFLFWKYNLQKTSILIFVIYFVIAVLEMGFTSRYTQITNYTYDTLSKIPIGKKPIIVAISNKAKNPITGVTLSINAEGAVNDDTTIISAKDIDTKQILFTSKTNDMLIPDTVNDYTIFFPKSIRSRNIQLSIYQEKNVNSLFVYQPITRTANTVIAYPRYDYFYSHKKPVIRFPEEVISVNLRGPYTVADFFENFLFQMHKKPKFYLIYFSVLTVLIFLLFLPKRFGIGWHK